MSSNVAPKAHEDAVASIVSDQQQYAAEKQIANIFEGLMLSLLFAKPADPLDHIGHAAQTMIDTSVVEPALPGRELDTEEGARTYLDEHRIYDVLEELFTSLLFSKPEHPLSFIVEESKRLKAIAGVAKGASRIFTEKDLVATHALYDPSGRGHISQAQVASAFRNLGIKSPPPETPELIDAATFVRIAQAAIAAATRHP